MTHSLSIRLHIPYTTKLSREKTYAVQGENDYSQEKFAIEVNNQRKLRNID